MNTFAQAIKSAESILASDAAAVSVNIEFVTAAGYAMTATVTRAGLSDVKLKA